MAGYKNPYAKRMKRTLNSILNRQEFAYDMNADAMYQLYKDQYMQQGMSDMQDTMGDVAAQTGGMISSAAVAAGNQAYQMNLTALNQKIPELYNTALQRYNTQTQDLYNQYGLLQSVDNTAYQRYRDKKADKLADKEYELQKFKYGL